MVEEFGVSYYGVMYPDRAVEDFKEMVEYGCNAVLLACSEFDVWFWFSNLVKLIEKAKELGLRVYVDPWGWGKVFGGEPPSMFLQEHAGFRQVSAKTGESLPSACFNTERFRRYVLSLIEKLAQETRLDLFFWDEPHYAMFWRAEGGDIRMLETGDWACRCEACRSLFKEEYGYEMPTDLTEDVVSFRQRKIVEFLGEMSKTVKQTDPRKGVCVCLLPTKSPLIGIIDWEPIASLDDVNMVSTDPYWVAYQKHGLLKAGFDAGISWFKGVLGELMALAKRYGKKSQVWVQAFRIPEGREVEIAKGIEAAAEMGVDSIFAWPYRAGEGSILASDRAVLLWRRIGETFKRLRGLS